MNKCIDKLSNVTGGPFPVNVFRNKNFLQISVQFNGTYDIYETISSGKEMCRITRGSMDMPSQEIKLLEDIYPECVR